MTKYNVSVLILFVFGQICFIVLGTRHKCNTDISCPLLSPLPLRDMISTMSSAFLSAREACKRPSVLTRCSRSANFFRSLYLLANFNFPGGAASIGPGDIAIFMSRPGSLILRSAVAGISHYMHVVFGTIHYNEVRR